MGCNGSSPTADMAAHGRASALPRTRAGALLLQLAALVLLGLVAALLQGRLKLRLGVPGHAAVLWLTPLLVARFCAPLAGAGTVASTSMAAGLYALDGFSFRWPVALSFGSFWLVGPVLDLCVLLMAAGGDGRATQGRRGLVLIPLAGVVGNFAHLAFKLLFGAMGAHAPGLGLPRGVFEAVTYLVFGLAAGALAYALLTPFRARGKPAA